uniref:Dec protein, OB-Fold, Decoration, VIRAL PROTEIN n=1 Tax=Siphoviridae sp. ctqrl18 TaxID=2825681 RepID=A0A8S5NV29_9CAUD|nr:MAG TPA: Dec protein, OB-Fold, Decoration, VIRAL PROTEIN [Siphoviridae sp. ctqrl18]
MPFLDGKPVILTKRNTDKHGNPISVKQIETKQISTIHNAIPLNYSIDRNHPIVINGFHQIYNQDEISDNTFFVDYDQGILYFHSSQVGKSLTVTYMGTGYILISSNRIYRYSKVNGAQGNVSIEASFEKIENLLNTVINGGNSLDATKAEVVAARTDADGKTYPSLGSRLDDMTTKLNNLNTILRHEKKIDVATPTSTINIGIPEYEPKTDIINLYLSGVRMIEDVDFRVDRTNKTITSLKGNWINQDQLYIEVLQKVNDGRGSSSAMKIDSKNVVLTTPIFNSTDAQSAFVATEKNINLKADKTELTKYLPLAGGTITGNLVVNGAITGNSSSATKLKTARNINGVAFDGSQDITIGISSGSEIKLGGYSKPTSTSSILVTDNLNTAIGKLEKGLEDKASATHDHNSAKITAMTNYQKGTVSAIQQTDSLNVAIGKLEATLDNKSNTSHTHSYAGSNAHNGAANSAVKLQTPRNITIGGTSNEFDGSGDITFTLANIGAAATNHNQTSNTITAMTGYTKGVTNGAITSTDTLNGALSKIENNLDGKANTNHNHNSVYLPLSGGTITGNLTVNNGTITGALNGNSSTSTKLQNARNINGVAFDGTKDITIGVTSGTQITLGGYTKPSSTSAITSADSLNAAIGKLEVGIDGKANASHNQASNTITTMTGYAKGTNSNAITTTDTLNQAIGKLEVGLGTKAPTNHSHNYLPLSGGTINGSLTVAGGGITGSLTGNATTATKLQTAKNINLTGGVTGTVSFDGSQNVSMTTTVASVTSDKVTRMTGYSKASAVSAIQQTDSLNVAIGKLEKAIEGKSAVTNITLIETIVEKTVQANSNSVSIGQTINNNDVVRVYLDGIRLFEGKTYTLTKGANAQITMSTGLNLQSGDIVTFEIVRVKLA